MALSANTVWEVRTAGNDTNGGGFVTGASGTDYSQQDSKNTVGTDISTVDGVANGTTTFNSATANFGTSIVGNIIYVAGGTGGITGVWRQVTARASSLSITLDVAVAASTGMTLNIGGALASPGQAFASAINGNIVYAKAGTGYTITSATQNISGGTVKLNAAGGSMCFIGYTTTRTDGGSATLTLNAGVSTATFISLVCQGYVANFILDGASQTTSAGVASNLANAGSLVYNVQVKNLTSTGFSPGNVTATFIKCSGTGCSSTVFLGGNNGTFIGCEAWGNTATPFSLSVCPAINCLSYNNTGGTTDGFTDGGAPILNCVAYGNGRDGFRNNNDGNFINCHAENNTGVGFRFQRIAQVSVNCTAYNNTGGAVSANAGAPAQTITSISGSAFVNAATSNFALNNTIGAGASLMAAGYPGVFPSGLTTGYLDIGAAQHQDSGGSSGMLFVPSLEGM